MKLVKKAVRFFDRVVDLLAALAGVLIILAMLIVAFEIVMRYFLDRPQIWVMDVTETILLYFTFLATAWLLKKDGHVKMDLVVNRLNQRTQVLLNIITSILGVVISWALVWYGAQVTWDHFQRGVYIPTPLRLPTAPVLVIIPIGSFLLLLQFLRRTYSYLRDGWGHSDKQQGYG